MGSQNVEPEDIKIDIKKVPENALIPIIQEREITLSSNGKAVNKDPVTVKSNTTKIQERKFSFYDIVAIIQRNTHFSFTEISEILETNKINRDTLIKAVEKNYLVIHGIANQILSQAMEY